MRPLVLRMEAFGPYSSPTTVDFTKMGSGLFLITGNTGSGKTMIFDAMTYALFGQTSGSRRSSESLHSDLTSAKPRVSLEFEHLGTRYEVVREPPYMRTTRTGEVKKTSPKAELYSNGELMASSVRDVNARVEGILGMDPDQWGQIVMLAQGEFMKLLDTNSKDRTEILRNLFGTDAYRDLQDTLAKLSSEKGLSYKHMVEDTDGKLSEFRTDLTDDLVGMPRDEQSKVIALTIERDGSAVKALECKKKETDAAYMAAVERKAEAGSLDAKFQELGTVERRLADLDSRREEFEGKIAMRDMIARSAPVAAAETELKAQNARLRTVEEDLEGAEAGIGRQTEILSELYSRSEEVECARREVDELGFANSRIRDMMPRYARARSLSDTVERLEEEMSQASMSKESSLRSLAEFETELSDVTSRIEGSSDAEARLASGTAKLDALRAESHRLRAERTAGSVTLDLESQIRRLENSFSMHDAQARALAVQFESAESLFLRSQAGMLASGLVDGEPCPVCGSVHHPSPASVPDGVPDRESINRLRKRREKEEEARSKVAEELAARRAEYDTGLARLREVSGCDGDASACMGALDGIIADSDDRESELAIEIKGLEALISGLGKLKERRTYLEDRREYMRRSVDDLSRRLSSLDTDLAAAKAEMGTVAEGLTYGSEEEAQAAIRSNDGTIAERTAFIDDIASRRTMAERDLAVLTSGKEQAEREIDVLLPLIDETARRLNSMLTELGLDMDGFHRLSGIDIDALNSEITGYTSERDHCAMRSSELRTELDGRTRPDMDGVQRAVDECNAVRESVDRELSAASERLDRNRSLWDSLQSGWEELEKRGRELDALQEMADAANGRLTGSVKVQFEQFVQARYFDRVLESANARLSDMSGGRFELCRRTDSTDLRSQTALDIDVLDNFTGKVRTVRSLSGGESFKAALSLALGLSDTIQMVAGGSRVDALFIDEGFGSLDSDSLNQALDVLDGLTAGNVMVGVISHVDLLRERIDRKICVTRRKEGSVVETVVD